MGNEILNPEGVGSDNDNSSPPFNKAEIREKFRQELIRMRDVYFGSAEDASQMARDADGPMQSRHDTAKTEQAWLANALTGMGEDLNELLADWNTVFPDEASKQVSLGSLVFLEDLDCEDKEWFYLMPFGRGISIEIENESIMVLSVESALGRNIIGKQKGQWIEFKAHSDDLVPQRFKVLEVF